MAMAKNYVKLNKRQVQLRLNTGWTLIADYPLQYMHGDMEVTAAEAHHLTALGEQVCLSTGSVPVGYWLEKAQPDGTTQRLEVNKTSGDSIFGLAGGKGRGRKPNPNRLEQFDVRVSPSWESREAIVEAVMAATAEDVEKAQGSPTVGGRVKYTIYLPVPFLQKIGGMQTVRRLITYISNQRWQQSPA